MMNKKKYLELFSKWPKDSYINTKTHGMVKATRIEYKDSNFKGIKYRYYEIDGISESEKPIILFRCRQIIKTDFKDIVIQ